MCTVFCAKVHSFLCKTKTIVSLADGNGSLWEISTLFGKPQEKTRKNKKKA